MEGWEKGDSQSANELGIIYDRYEKKPDEAERWWKLAAEQGVVEAQYNLGLFYEGKLKNLNQAKYWYEKAMEQGYKDAKERLENLEKVGK